MPRPVLPLALLALLRLGLPAGAYTPDEARSPMTVTLVRSDAPSCGTDCPEWLALTGKIGFETPGRLAAALARLGRRRVPVLLDSPGGESLAGLAMGRMIRAHGLDTAVATTTLVPCGAGDALCRGGAGERDGHVGPDWGVVHTPACASACVLALAGGVDRAVPSDAFVGVHQAKRVLTFHPVMNTFRVLSRVVNGRKVEVGRTLVASRALPVRVVTEAAPQSVYDQFERTLLGLGIDESIVPLMRATPPSGIHWMTAAELASTRLANDTTGAEAFVKREAEAQAAAASTRNIRLEAALTLDDARRWKGEVVWRIDAASPGMPSLTGDWAIPERHLRGSVSIRADAAPATPAALRLAAHFGTDPGAGASRILAVHPPSLCDLQLCSNPFAGPVAFDRPDAAFDVVPARRTDALAGLHRRDWLTFRVRSEDGWGWLALTLSSPDASAVAAWERLCCAFAAADWPWNPPASSLPDFPKTPEPFRVLGIGTVRAAPGAGKAPVRTLAMPALFDAAPMGQHGFPAPDRGSVTWFPLVGPAEAGKPGTTVLLGSAALPALGLRTSIEVASSPSGTPGGLTVRLHTVADDERRFGPLKGYFVLNAYDAENHPLLLTDAVSRFSGLSGVEARIDIPETGPVPGVLQVGFDDARGRRVTLAFPLDPPLAALLQAAERHGGTGGS